jgi:outer membrane protein assembly factor BamD
MYRIRRFLYLFIALLVVSSCSEYQKVLKSTDPAFKYKKAKEYFEAAKYAKAFPLFDEVLTLYRGTDKQEEVYYFLAMTHFRLKEYILSAYHFKNFVRSFPKSEFSEEAMFMAGYSYFLESPDYSLEQSYTYKAINELQLFINTYRTSPRIDECNQLIADLRRKLERKAYQNAKQYFTIGHYQSASMALTNVLEDYPETSYREDIMYLIVKSKHELAKFSIESKQLQRYIETRTAALRFEEFFPESKKLEETRSILENVNAQIELIQNDRT